MATTAVEYTRQRDWFDPSQSQVSATVVGCGGIGSFAGMALAKLGVRTIRLLDFDYVEAHNVPNQNFSAADVGTAKAEALAENLAQMRDGDLDFTIEPTIGSIADGVPLSDVVVSALDSMDARAELWQAVRMKPRVQLFIDGRLSGQKIVLYAVEPARLAQVKAYESTLYSDEEAEMDSCTARSVIDVGFIVAALIANTVRKFYANETIDSMVYMNAATLQLQSGDILDVCG